jgi:hypothetical protein
MAQPQSLLVRLLDTPNLPTIVPRLPAEVLHSVIQHVGLEDCAEFVALATPAQLERVLDADVWRARTPGVDEEFDADRFGLWLEVLMQAGVAVAIEKLAGLDIDLVITGLSSHAAVFDQATVAQHITLEGELAGGRVLTGERVAEIGGYVLDAKRTSAWDAITELLVSLESAAPDLFRRVMLGCVDLSSPPPEESGFHDLLDDDEQNMFDAAADREARREKHGYVSPAQARAFLQGARDLRLDAGDPPGSPIARAHFRALESTPLAGGHSNIEVASEIEADAIAGVVELLREGGVLGAQPRALLAAAGKGSTRLALFEAHVESHPESPEELAFLTNSLIAGCTIQERAFTVQEAAGAVAAACNLGLENWPDLWSDRSLIAAFQVGWAVLHRDVAVHAATRLIDVAAHVQTNDRLLQLRLTGLRRELTHFLRDRAPERLVKALDVILMLDAQSWAALTGLLGECPVMQAGIATPPESRRAIKAADFEFISQNRQIETVRAFLTSLPYALTR